MKLECGVMKYFRRSALGALLTATTFYCACTEERKAQEAAMFSCVSSIHAALINTGGEESVKVPALGSEWHVLTNAEKTALLSAPSISRRLDCHNFKTDDPHLHVAARRLTQDRQTEYVVWFDGVDRVAGTSDDISSNPGATVLPSP